MVHHVRKHHGSVGRYGSRQDPGTQVSHALRGGILLPPVLKITPQCTCGASAGVHSATALFMGAGVVVHIAGCAVLRFKELNSARFEPLKPPPKPAKIMLTTGELWVPKKRVQRRKIEDRRAKSNYKLLLQFFFERPVDINLWKRIKAPRGWRKCPTGK